MAFPTTDEVIASFVKPEWKDVARLIATTAEMMERERCASIAEKYRNYELGNWAGDIADEIREHPNP